MLQAESGCCSRWQSTSSAFPDAAESQPLDPRESASDEDRSDAAALPAAARMIQNNRELPYSCVDRTRDAHGVP